MIPVHIHTIKSVISPPVYSSTVLYISANSIIFFIGDGFKIKIYLKVLVN